MLRGVGSLELFLMRNFIVASVFGRYLATSSAVNPCHDVKSLRLMAWMKVLLDGLNKTE